uniref:Uncharacterized protein n=1 Tax=Triticum urartu TaxID=4572 RepID=A0A8R7NYA9_TRIUA
MMNVTMLGCLSLLNHNFMKCCCRMQILGVFYSPLCIPFVFAFLQSYSLDGVIDYNFTSSMFILFFKHTWKLLQDTSPGRMRRPSRAEQSETGRGGRVRSA